MLNSSRKERSMNKQLILIVGGILLVGTFLVGAIWGWLTLLEYLIGVFLVTLIVFSRYALLKNYPLSTMLYTVPTSWLYRVMNPQSRNQSRDLDDLFPSQKTQEPDGSEELPPFRFTKATEEQRVSNTEEHKN
jgi:predicted MFS family arabinose efflux permease